MRRQQRRYDPEPRAGQRHDRMLLAVRSTDAVTSPATQTQGSPGAAEGCARAVRWVRIEPSRWVEFGLTPAKSAQPPHRPAPATAPAPLPQIANVNGTARLQPMSKKKVISRSLTQPRRPCPSSRMSACRAAAGYETAQAVSPAGSRGLLAVTAAAPAASKNTTTTMARVSPSLWIGQAQVRGSPWELPAVRVARELPPREVSRRGCRRRRWRR